MVSVVPRAVPLSLLPKRQLVILRDRGSERRMFLRVTHMWIDLNQWRPTDVGSDSRSEQSKTSFKRCC